MQKHCLFLNHYIISFVDVECILHKDLERYLKSDRYLSSRFLPITRHRGISHVNNPHAKPDDLVLINIYIDGKLEAYRGFLPDTFLINGKETHVAWLSCIWVNPKMRGKGLAKQIMKTTWEYWGENLFSTTPSTNAKSLYLGTGKFEILELENTLKCHRRLNLALFLTRRNHKWEKFNWLLKVADSCFNSIWNLKSLFFRKKYPAPFLIKEISKMDDKTFKFIQPFRVNSLVNKTIEDYHWHINFPWLKNTEEAKVDQERYFFSSYAERFGTTNYQFFENNQLVAFITITIRNGELKVPFIFFDEKNSTLAKSITNHLFQVMKKEKITTIATSNKILKELILKRKHEFFLIQNVAREYMISKKIQSELNGNIFTLQDGDGDAVFT